MGWFDFVTNPINDAWDSAINSNPITSGISDAVHTVGENTGINDVVDTVAPYVAAAAAIYLTGGALAPEAMTALEGGAAEAGLTAEEYAALVANSAPVDAAMAGAEAPSLLSQVGSAYSALPSAVQTGLSTLGKTALSKGVNSLLGGGSNSSASNTASGLNNATTAGNMSDSSPQATLLKGNQIASPLASSYNIPVNNYIPPSVNPQSLSEIQNAAEGGIMRMSEGGDLPMTPKQLRGQSTQHPSLMGWHGPQLFADGGMAFQDRTLPEGHNPKFFSEGGLSSMENRYVTGDGDGTSDSIAAMLANGEFVIPADVVSGLGNGSNDAGAEVLNAFMETIRKHKQKHDAKNLPPDSLGPLAYLKQAKQKASA